MTSDRNARREARQRAAHRRTEPDAPPAGETALRSKPVRITVDLSPEQYRRLTSWATETAAEEDLVKLPLADIVRASIRLLDDPEVRWKMRAALRDMRQ